MNQHSSFLKNNIFVFSNRAFSKVLTFFLMLFLARKLNPVGFGELAILLTMSSMFALFLDLGSSFIVVREIASKNFDADDVLYSTLFAKILFGIVSFSGLILLAYLMGYNNVIIKASYIFACGQLFESFLLTVIKYYEGQERMAVSSVLQISERVIIVASIFLFYNFTTLINSYGFAYITSNLSVLVIGIILSKKLMSFWRHIKIDITKKILIYSLPFIIFNVFSVVYNRIDIFIISHYYNEYQVGLYRACFQLIESIYFISLGLNVTLLPYFARKFKEHKEDTKSKYSIVSKELFSLGILIAILIYANSSSILDLLYKSKYLKGSLTFSILSITIPFYFVSNIMGNLLIAIGKEKFQIASMVISTIIKLVLLFILIKMWGIVGAAVSAAIAELISFSIQYWATNKNGFLITIIKKDYVKIIALILYLICAFLINNLLISFILLLSVSYFVFRDTISFLKKSLPRGADG